MTDNKVISCNSPLGYIVECSEDCWKTHIVEGHEIMKDNLKAVENAITNPIIIYSSLSDPKVDVYFGKSYNATYGDKFYTKVIVSDCIAYNEETEIHDVKSAWPQKDISGNISKEIRYVNTKF